MQQYMKKYNPVFQKGNDLSEMAKNFLTAYYRLWLWEKGSWNTIDNICERRRI